jgi:hypothetical protein
MRRTHAHTHTHIKLNFHILASNRLKDMENGANVFRNGSLSSGT